ncbi:MAG: hypothetical protein EOM76_11095 [Sphingobacteriia bacterium]|nr:hypothetical protein [Sphingobacteriia bacterium]
MGGGDWSPNRLIPDCIRHLENHENIHIRSPHSTRPWQHVLEPISGYLRLGEMMISNPVDYADCFNFGPHLSSNKTVWQVASKLIQIYGSGSLIDDSDPRSRHEDKLLNLDITKAHCKLNWHPKLSLNETLEYTVAWYKEALKSNDMYDFCANQISMHNEKKPRDE